MILVAGQDDAHAVAAGIEGAQLLGGPAFGLDFVVRESDGDPVERGIAHVEHILVQHADVPGTGHQESALAHLKAGQHFRRGRIHVVGVEVGGVLGVLGPDGADDGRVELRIGLIHGQALAAEHHVAIAGQIIGVVGKGGVGGHGALVVSAVLGADDQLGGHVAQRGVGQHGDEPGAFGRGEDGRVNAVGLEHFAAVQPLFHGRGHLELMLGQHIGVDHHGHADVVERQGVHAVFVGVALDVGLFEAVAHGLAGVGVDFVQNLAEIIALTLLLHGLDVAEVDVRDVGRIGQIIGRKPGGELLVQRVVIGDDVDRNGGLGMQLHVLLGGVIPALSVIVVHDGEDDLVILRRVPLGGFLRGGADAKRTEQQDDGQQDG